MKKTVAILLVVSVVLCCGCKKKSRRSKFDDDKTIENIEDFEEYLGKKLDADARGTACGNRRYRSIRRSSFRILPEVTQNLSNSLRIRRRRIEARDHGDPRV